MITTDLVKTKMDLCDNCEYYTKVKLYEFYEDNGPYYFCDVCAGTWLDMATKFPNQVNDKLMCKSVAHLFNQVLDEIRDVHDEMFQIRKALSKLDRGSDD